MMCWCSFVFLSYLVVSAFFFFKQKTAYEMRISDWSSDVCSSDLALFLLAAAAFIDHGGCAFFPYFREPGQPFAGLIVEQPHSVARRPAHHPDRKSVV